MVKLLISLVLFLSPCLPLFGGGSGQFHLDKKIDIPILGTGVASIITGAVLRNFAAPPDSPPEGWTAWPSFDYDKGLADGSDYLLLGGLAALPFLMDQWAREDALTLGVMYVEAMALSWGIKESLKMVFTKYRPFTQSDSPPEELMAERDRYFSFPSGHSTMAFTTAGFAAAVFTASDAPDWAKVVFTAANFFAASGVAALRVVSGKHYLVDVAVGALIGTASGMVIPLLHRHNKKEGITLGIGPSSLMVGISY